MIVSAVADATGIPESSLTLLVSMLLAYPVAWCWQFLPSITAKHIYSAATGLWLLWFAYGPDAVLHSAVAITITWALLKTCPPSVSLPLGWVFNVAYLLVGYYHYLSPDGYTLNWTTPQCVLTLRLIGTCFDVSDGQLPEAAMDKDAVARHLTNVPNFLEMLSYNYHFGGVLVGPQFPYRLYEKFVTGKLMETPRPSSGLATLECFLGGLFYLLVSQAFGIFFPPEVVMTKKYLEGRPFLVRLAHILLCSRGFMYKYLGAWKLGEAPNILTGLSYNGRDAAGQPRWDGVTNIYLLGYEFATKLQHIIETFNINTNTWMKVYVMKRLRFLGNKNASQLGALMFLALWHGPYLGYFFSFAMEFMDMMIERVIVARTQPISEPWFKDTATPTQKILGRIWCAVAWLITASALAYGAIPFILLTLGRCIEVFNTVYWVGHIVYPLFFVYMALKPKKKRKAV